MIRLNPNVIANKIDRMIARIDKLKVFQTYTIEQYLDDETSQLVIERLLELVIQSALDINGLLLKQVAGINRVTNAESFNETARAGFISIEAAQLLTSSGRFRNTLAHQYDEVAPEAVFQEFQTVLANYPDYIEAIQNYLDSREATSND